MNQISARCKKNWSRALIYGALTLRLPTNRPRDLPTHNIRPQNILSTVTIFYCDTLTMWHFSTVTFRLCDIFLLWHSDWQFSTVTFRLKVEGMFVHPKKWTACHTVTLWPTVILANPWLWHFVHFRFWFFPLIPCQSYSWFWRMTISWHYPFNFFAFTHRFRRPRPDRGCVMGGVFSITFPIRPLV